MKRALVLCALAAMAVACVVCAGGLKRAAREFDRMCVEGRLSAEQVAAINALPWEKCPQYRDGECRAEVNDRVVARECSEALRSLTYGED